MDRLLKRKVDAFLQSWKEGPDRKPLIVKGARQIGKTLSIEHFAHRNYAHVVEINFVEQKKFQNIFDDGFEVESILKNISLLSPGAVFVPGKTLFFFCLQTIRHTHQHLMLTK